MGRVRFEPGTRFILNGEWFIIREILLGQKLLVESQSLGGKTERLMKDLVVAFSNGSLQFEALGRHTKANNDSVIPIDYAISDFDVLPEPFREEARRRYDIIKPLVELPTHERTRKKIEEHVSQLRLESGLPPSQPDGGDRSRRRKGKKRGRALSRSSVEEWLNNYLDSGQDLRSLVDGKYKGAISFQKRLNSETEDIIQSVLNRCEKNPKYRTTEDVYMEVVNRIADENLTRPQDIQLKLPSQSTIYRRIREKGIGKILRRRQSRTEQQSSEPVKAGPRPTRILERVEFDDTPLHLIVVDEEDRLPIGRPVLVYGIDCFSAYPVGYYVSFEPPSYKTTMSCLLHSILPKPDTGELYGTENTWLARGLPELAVIDNGKAFVNRHLLDAFGMLGVPVDQCPVRTPWFKGSVERQFRTTNSGLVHLLPGTTFSNVLERGDYDPEKEACITLSAFERILNIFIVDFYAHKWHKGIKGIPAQKWMESERDGFIPSLPTSADELRILLYWNDQRTLQRTGIEYETITYQGSDLGRLRSLLSREDRRVSIRINPDDISYIYVLDPLTKTDWLRFDANDPIGYTEGLSIWKHSIIQKMASKEKNEKVDIFALARAKARIQQFVGEEYLTTRSTQKRKKAARYLKESENDVPPKRIKSEGIGLCPPITEDTSLQSTYIECQDELQKHTPKNGNNKLTNHPTSTQKTNSETNEFDESGNDQWGSDYCLPQNQ